MKSIDELIKEGVLSNAQIASEYGVSEDVIAARRTQIDNALKQLPSASPVETFMEEYVKTLRKTQKDIQFTADGLLRHISVYATGDELVTPQDLRSLTQSLEQLRKMTLTNFDETSNAILHLLETDILPEQTSAKIIQAIEDSQVELRSKTRKIMHTTGTQLTLFEND